MYIGPKSRTERPRNTKIGTVPILVPHVTQTPLSRSKGQLAGRPPAQLVMFTTGSQDCSVRLWELSTGRCMRTLKFKFPVRDVAWNPNSSYSTVAAAVYVFCIL